LPGKLIQIGYDIAALLIEDQLMIFNTSIMEFIEKIEIKDLDANFFKQKIYS